MLAISKAFMANVIVQNRFKRYYYIICKLLEIFFSISLNLFNCNA